MSNLTKSGLGPPKRSNFEIFSTDSNSAGSYDVYSQIDGRENCSKKKSNAATLVRIFFVEFHADLKKNPVGLTFSVELFGGVNMNMCHFPFLFSKSSFSVLIGSIMWRAGHLVQRRRRVPLRGGGRVAHDPCGDGHIVWHNFRVQFRRLNLNDGSIQIDFEDLTCL